MLLYLGYVLAIIFLSLWVWYLLRYTQLKVTIKAHEQRHEERKKYLEESHDKLEQAFKSLASDTLEKQTDSFLKLATENLKRGQSEARGAFQEKVLEFQKLLHPMRETVSRLETDIKKVEKDRWEQFSRISEQLMHVSKSNQQLKEEASSLSRALRRPEVRGSWGEIQLRRVVELAGMSPYCDFEEQVSVRDDQKNLFKPDLIVRLPNERTVVVDSKAVLDAFLDYSETDDEKKKQEALLRHAKNVRSRISELSKKSYWEQFESSPDFAVLFIPNEALLQTAVEVDRSLIEDALKEKVVLATPTTLVALLKAIHYGWQQNKVAENAQHVIRQAKDFYDRLIPWLKHLNKVGDHLESATKSFNASVGSLDTRVLPQARKLRDLGLEGREDLPKIKISETQVKKNIDLIE